MKRKLVLPLVFLVVCSVLAYALTFSGITDPLPYLQTSNISVVLTQSTSNCTFFFVGGNTLVTNTSIGIESTSTTPTFWFLYNPEVENSGRGCRKTVKAECVNDTLDWDNGTSSTFCLWGYVPGDVDDITIDASSNFLVAFIPYMALIALVIVIVVGVKLYKKHGGKLKW